MSIDQIIPLAVIVGAFVLFAVVLAWEDYRTQQAMALKKDDKSAAAASATAKARWPQPSDDRLQHGAMSDGGSRRNIAKLPELLSKA
jgi:hypothetical protein